MSLFPLQMTPFEHYMLADDHGEYPTNFLLRCTFGAPLDPDRLRSALSSVCDGQHLLLASPRGLPRNRTKKLHWVTTAPDHQPTLTLLTEQLGRSLRIPKHLDLEKSAGLRLWLYPKGDKCVLLGQFHHSCCDGIGAIHFLESLLCEYDRLARQGAARRDGVWRASEEWWCERARQGKHWPADWLRLFADLRRVAAYLGTKPRPLFSFHTEPMPVDEQRPVAELVSQTLNENETSEICSGAKLRNVTVNDILVAALFLAINEWNSGLAGNAKSRPVRIAVPISLRADPDQTTPAINAMSFVLLDRLPAAETGESLLNSVHAEMRDVKRRGTAWTLIQSLRLAGTIPGGVSLLLPRDRCLTTSVMSNYGVMLGKSPLNTSDARIVAGGIPLERIEPFVPIRPHLRAGLSAITYARRMTLTITQDSRWLTIDDARHFLDLTTGYIQQIARSPSSHAPPAGQTVQTIGVSG